MVFFSLTTKDGNKSRCVVISPLKHVDLTRKHYDMMDIEGNRVCVNDISFFMILKSRFIGKVG